MHDFVDKDMLQPFNLARFPIGEVVTSPGSALAGPGSFPVLFPVLHLLLGSLLQQSAIDQAFGDLYGVQGRTFAQVVGDNPKIDAILDG